MPVLSYIHQLFNAEHCQAYIHALRWKDRPLQCPHCQSHNVGPWGTYHYQPGLKRYHCKDKDCKRTFNDLTGTLLDCSKRSLRHWIFATFLLCLSCSSRRIAKELGVQVRTGYRWCWWLRNAALSASSYRALTGYLHEYVNHTKKEYARGDVRENRAECLFSLLKPYLRGFRGISKFNLPGYVGFFQFLRNFRQQNAFEQAEMILYAALDPAIASQARKGDFVRCLDHFDLLQSPIN